jgi:uncharacterized protein
MKNLYPDFMGVWDGQPTADDVQVVECPEIGYHLVAARDFPAGRVMFRFGGIATPELTQHSLRAGLRSHIHDPWVMGVTAHSCEPNVYVDMSTLSFVALREVRAGEKITMHYMQTEDRLYKPFDCKCGAPTCEGRIG